MRLTVLPDDVHLAVREGETILSAICRAGFTYRFGCQRGGCATCKVELLAGQLSYERPIAASVLSPGERDRGLWLSCRAVPSTDVIVALQQGDRLKTVIPLGFQLA